jgi:hypothetical protein
MVLGGGSASTFFADKTSELWRERELAAWFRGSGIRRYPDESRLAEEQFQTAFDFRKATERNAAVLARAAERGFGT